MKTYLTLAAAAASLIIAGAPAQAQTKLKWAHVYETSEQFHIQSVWAAAEFKKRTNGKYEFEVYPASQLGKETDINQGLTLGSVDVILTGASFAARVFPPIGVVYYPYIFRDSDHLIAYTKSDVYRELAKGYEDKSGHKILATTYYGARESSSNKPFKTCAEMKGLKIRVPDVPAYLAMPRACGANTAPIAFAEVYLALQNGTVEAEENPLPTIEAKKFYEVQKHIILTGHIIDGLNTVAAKGFWAKLTADEQKIFTEIAQEASVRATKEVRAQELKLIDFFKGKGVTVTEVDKADFKTQVEKNVTLESFGYRKADYDRIQAIK